MSKDSSMLTSHTPKQTETAVLAVVQQALKRGSHLNAQFYGTLGVRPTPLQPASHTTSKHQVYIKDETNHQLVLGNSTYEANSFKRRGGLMAAILALKANPDTTMFHVPSHGNMGVGVALAGLTFGVPVTMHGQDSISRDRLKKLHSYGAYTETTGYTTFEDAAAGAAKAAEQPGHALLHPFDEVSVIAGHATIGYEIVLDLLEREKAGQLDLHKTPIEIDIAIAGGGFLTGVAIVVKHFKDLGVLGEHNVHVVGAQMVRCDAAKRSVDDVRAGGNGRAVFQPGELDERCESTAVSAVGGLTLPFMANHDYVQEIRIVSPAEVATAMHALSSQLGKMIEPAGALAYAAAHQKAQTTTTQTIFVATVCGANVTAEMYQEFMNLREDAREQDFITA